MSQSRLYKVGTIYSRAQALLKAGAIKPEYKPRWIEVYEAFPPKLEPRWDRPAPKADDPIPRIVYKEDIVRAQFYRQFGDTLEVVDLLEGSQPQAELLSQKFVNKFNELQADEEKELEEAFLDTVNALKSEGINLRKMNPKEAMTLKIKPKPTPMDKDIPPAVEALKSGSISFRELFSEKQNDEKD